MLTKSFEIISETGVHSRPAANLVSAATKFKSSFKFIVKENVVDLKSIIGVMSLAVTAGEKIVIEIIGIDEFEAMTEITKVIITTNLGKEIR